MRVRSIVNATAGVLLMFTGVVGGAVLTSTAGGAATSHPSLVVRPSGSLKNNETVKVRGLHFTPNDTVFLVECLANAKGQGSCDTSAPVMVNVNGKGTFGWTKFKVHTGTIGSGTTAGTCGTKRTDLKKCAISAGNASGGDSTMARITFVMASS